MRDNNSKKVAEYGLFIALAFILSYIESLYSLGGSIPGIKIGLANLVVIVVLYIHGWKKALSINLIRVILVGFMFGSMMSIIYGMVGAMASFLVMIICKKNDYFSVKGVSITGAITHNIAQILVAIIFLKTNDIAYYLPILIIVGVITGLVIGIIGDVMIVMISKIRM